MNSVNCLLLSNSTKSMFIGVGEKTEQRSNGFQNLMNSFSLMDPPSDKPSLVDKLETVDEAVLDAMLTFIQTYEDPVSQDELLHLLSEQFSIDVKTVEEIFPVIIESVNNTLDVTTNREHIYFIDQLMSKENLVPDELIYQIQLFVNELQKMLKHLDSDSDSLKQVSS